MRRPTATRTIARSAAVKNVTKVDGGRDDALEAVHVQLARAYKVRLPRADAKLTTANQAAFLKRLGLTWAKLGAITGEKRAEFISLNGALFTLRDWAGIVLEGLDYMKPARI